jgi:DNA-binding MarR family transcriptional regulator
MSPTRRCQAAADALDSHCGHEEEKTGRKKGAVMTQGAKVVPITAGQGLVKKLTGKVKKESEKKWGRDVLARGFLIVPAMIVRAQARLGLDAAHLNVLLHLADHWWQAARLPYPSKARIAERMGVTPRQVQRYLTALEKRGFITRLERRGPQGGRLNNAYNLSGFVAALKKLEPEFKKEQQDAQARRAALEKKQGARRAPPAAAASE